MTGRHWWIPYIPRDGWYEILKHGWYGWEKNLKLGRSFFERRANMRRFRDRYLVQSKKHKLLFSRQLRKCSCQYYIVGSDQIWNPDITLGLRTVYFGAFENKNKKKVIAYAASLGGVSLSSEYDEEFSELLEYVDHISVRESAAIPYIRQFSKKNIVAVLDPVFLLKKETWQRIEKSPGKERYIFVYTTERNNELVDYVQELAKREKLSILQIKGGMDLEGKNVVIDYTAGPAEFLGYIHKADYIVTNSFHGVAFSIIFQKKFTVFQHTTVGTRISNILTICGLENRLYQKGREDELNFHMKWDKVEKYIEENVRLAEKYLIDCLRA